MRSGERRTAQDTRTPRPPVGGLAGWLLHRLLHRRAAEPPRLTLLERISLAPRQSLALVEAEGRRLLVATSPDGAPVFYALDEAGHMIDGPRAMRSRASGRDSARRVSW